MPNSGHEAVRTILASQIDRLWRFGLVLSGSRPAAEDLVRIASIFG
jgi:DNA-directed RNA polymerase specialized sigma24 family protein